MVSESALTGLAYSLFTECSGYQHYIPLELQLSDMIVNTVVKN
jgi:hypothetical protein